MSDPSIPESAEAMPSADGAVEAPSPQRSQHAEARVPQRPEPSTSPSAKVIARPEPAGHTADGEAMVRLAEGDRRAPTRREANRKAIDEAIAAAKAVRGEASPLQETRPSVSDVNAVAPPAPRTASLLIWVGLPLLVVGVLIGLKTGPSSRPSAGSQAALTSTGLSPPHEAPVDPVVLAPLPAPASDEDSNSPREPEEAASLATVEGAGAAPKASASPSPTSHDPKDRAAHEDVHADASSTDVSRRLGEASPAPARNRRPDAPSAPMTKRHPDAQPILIHVKSK